MTNAIRPSMTEADARPPGRTRFYRAYGMTIEVACAVPRLAELPSPAGSDPLALELGPVPASLTAAESVGEWFQATTSDYLYRQPGAWAMLVRDGRSACFEALSALDEELFWYLAITNAAAIAGYQRGMFPLHGSAVLLPAGAVAFVGASGVGKTSLAAGLVRRGCPAFVDDLCLVRAEAGRYLCGRGAPELRLIGDAADALGWDRAQSIGHQPQRDKYAFVHAAAPVEDAPVRAIVALAFDEGPTRLERLDGVAPFATLVAAIRLRMGLHRFPRARRAAAFELVSAMARSIPVYRLVRPRSYASFDAGVDLLMKEFAR